MCAAIFACLCCFWPTGLAAIRYADRVILFFDYNYSSFNSRRYGTYNDYDFQIPPLLQFKMTSDQFFHQMVLIFTLDLITLGFIAEMLISQQVYYLIIFKTGSSSYILIVAAYQF